MTFATIHLFRPLLALVKKEYTSPSPIHIRVLSLVLTGRTATREVLHHSNDINKFINVNPMAYVHPFISQPRKSILTVREQHGQ